MKTTKSSWLCCQRHRIGDSSQCCMLSIVMRLLTRWNSLYKHLIACKEAEKRVKKSFCIENEYGFNKWRICGYRDCRWCTVCIEFVIVQIQVKSLNAFRHLFLKKLHQHTFCFSHTHSWLFNFNDYKLDETVEQYLKECNAYRSM